MCDSVWSFLENTISRSSIVWLVECLENSVFWNFPLKKLRLFLSIHWIIAKLYFLFEESIKWSSYLNWQSHDNFLCKFLLSVLLIERVTSFESYWVFRFDFLHFFCGSQQTGFQVNRKIIISQPSEIINWELFLCNVRKRLALTYIFTYIATNRKYINHCTRDPLENPTETRERKKISK